MMQTQRMSPGADVCEKSIRTKSEDVDNDLDFGFISIHAPRVGSDPEAGGGEWPALIFQSTLPVWGATPKLSQPRSTRPNFNPRSPCGERRGGPVYGQRNNGDFNPRSPCGERLSASCDNVYCFVISIHAPRVGSDVSTICDNLNRFIISIHAPRVGSDQPKGIGGNARQNFNPRSPCGERRNPRPSSWRRYNFQSTLPVWGATVYTGVYPYWYSISIHAPRVGSDPGLVWGGLVSSISIHAPRVGSDSS